MNFKNMVGNLKVKAGVFAPELSLGAGLVFGLAGVVYACAGTLKASKKLPEQKAKIEKYHEEHKEDAKATELMKLYGGVAKEVIADFAPAAIYVVASDLCHVKVYSSLSARAESYASGFAAVSAAFAAYRARAKEKLGEEAENEIAYDIREEEVVAYDEEGNTITKITKKAHTIPCGIVMRPFGENNPDSPHYVVDQYESTDYKLTFLRMQQDALERMLSNPAGKRYLTVNEIFKELGYDKGTVDGQNLVVIRDDRIPEYANVHVDLGVFDKHGCLLPSAAVEDGLPIMLNIHVNGTIEDCYRLGLITN